MRTTCGTILAVALAALSAHGAFGKKDPMATKACRHNSIDAAGVFFATFAFFAA
jgi:hypothetical protein